MPKITIQLEKKYEHTHSYIIHIQTYTHAYMYDVCMYVCTYRQENIKLFTIKNLYKEATREKHAGHLEKGTKMVY